MQCERTQKIFAAICGNWIGTASNREYDDAPELTDDQLARATLAIGGKPVRGRPRLENPKSAIKLRIDADVIHYFRSTGPGWQTRINDTLRRAAKRKLAKSG